MKYQLIIFIIFSNSKWKFLPNYDVLGVTALGVIKVKRPLLRGFKPIRSRLFPNGVCPKEGGVGCISVVYHRYCLMALSISTGRDKVAQKFTAIAYSL